MSKKYIYNPQTLDYEEYTPSTRKRIGWVLLFIIVAGIIGYSTVALIQNTIGSPKERMQAREIEYLKLQYDIVNDRIENINALLGEMQDRDDNIYRMIFEAEPIPSSVRKAGYGGTNRYEALGGYANSNIVTDVAKKIDIVESQIKVQSKSFDDVYLRYANYRNNKERATPK